MSKKVSSNPLKNTVTKIGTNTRQYKVELVERHSVLSVAAGWISESDSWGKLF